CFQAEDGIRDFHVTEVQTCALPILRFFDVWHGIPFKGFDADDFRVQHRYDECWVASPLLRDLYIQRFGFEPQRVVATGYARTDRSEERRGGKVSRTGCPARREREGW